MADPIAYQFGIHRLEPRSHRLLAQGQVLPLGGRAFDLLLALVERRGRTVGKDELLDLVWPGLVVEDNNLQVQVGTLRRLLGRETIVTVPGRGYRFTAEVTMDQGAPAASHTTVTTAPTPPLAAPAVPPLFGRSQDLDDLLARLRQHPLVTLTGTGGVGKTRLAEAALASWPQGGVWVTLAPLGSPADVPQALARALGVTPGERALDAAVAALTARPRLLVIDNAEHLLEAVADTVQSLRQRCPGAHLLVTSQRALRLPDEQVLRLGPLALPAGTDLAGAQASAAVSLFVARAQAAERRFALDAGNAPAVVDICRRLAGLPLALELAAARVPLLGVNGVRARLDDQLQLLTGGVHGAPARQQTLRSALSWSHDLLDEPAQRVLHRVAVFRGGFTVEAAQHAARDDGLDDWAVIDLLGQLVDHSLVLAEGDDPPRYRLLDSTRLFALEQLQRRGETALAQQRQAEATVSVLQALRAAHPRPNPALVRGLSAELDNARCALRWADDQGDAARGQTLALVTALADAFAAANQHAEYLQRVAPWVTLVRDGGASAPDAAALLRRVATAGKSASHALALEAALQALPLVRAGAGSPRELHDLLIVAVAVGARRGAELPYQALLDEALALQQPDWPLPSRSQWHWARERWLQRAGRTAEAAASALAQADALSAYADVGAPQICRLNAADYTLALGHAALAESQAREALAALQAVQAPPSALGYAQGLLGACLARHGDTDAALQCCALARPALEIEGDEDLLLPVLAQCALARGEALAGACLVGLVDHLRAQQGWLANPDEQAERARLLDGLARLLPPAELSAALARGATLTRAEALALGLNAQSSTA